MNQKFSYLQSFKIIVLALLVAVGTGYLFADFSAPTQAPPGCPAGSPGCDAPINTSITSQKKLGQLFINTSTSNPFAVGLQVFGKSIFTKSPNDQVAVDVTGTIKTTNLQVTAGAGNVGKVLKFSDNLGNITWEDPSGPTDNPGTGTKFGYVDVPSSYKKLINNDNISYFEISSNFDEATPDAVCASNGYLGSTGTCVLPTGVPGSDSVPNWAQGSVGARLLHSLKFKGAQKLRVYCLITSSGESHVEPDMQIGCHN